MNEHGELEPRQARRGLILQVEGCASYSRLARAVGTNEGVTLAASIASLSRLSRTRQPLLVLAYSDLACCAGGEHGRRGTSIMW